MARRAVPLPGAATGVGVPAGIVGVQRRGHAPWTGRGRAAGGTGLQATELRHLGHLYEAYGFCSQGFDVYLATGLTAGPPKREATEQDMRHRHVPHEELRHLLRTGEIVDGPSVAAYGLLLLHDLAR